MYRRIEFKVLSMKRDNVTLDRQLMVIKNGAATRNNNAAYSKFDTTQLSDHC